MSQCQKRDFGKHYVPNYSLLKNSTLIGYTYLSHVTCKIQSNCLISDQYFSVKFVYDVSSCDVVRSTYRRMTALCVSSNSNFFYEILQFSAQPISAGIEPFLNIFSSEIVFFLLTSYFFILLLLCFSFMFLLLLRTRSFDLICVSVGRLVASSTRRPQFASSHRQNLY